MNSKPELVSIIIPVYNDEDFVSKCLLTVEEQSYPLIEIVIVDDGSSDRSSELCEQYANTSKRNVVFLKQENSGVSRARNNGIQHAHGKYITFIDADDYVESDYIKVLVDSIQSEISEMSICGFYYESESGATILSTKGNKTIYRNHDEAMQDTFRNDKFQGVICGKLFLTSLIRNNGLLFDVSIDIYEDHLFCVKYMALTRKIIFNNLRLYHYVKHNGSVVNRRAHIDDTLAYSRMESFVDDESLLKDIRLMKLSIYVRAYPRMKEVKATAIRKEIRMNLLQFVVSRNSTVHLKVLAVLESLLNKKYLNFILNILISGSNNEKYKS